MYITTSYNIGRPSKLLQFLIIFISLAPIYSGFSVSKTTYKATFVKEALILNDTVPNSNDNTEPIRKTRTYRVKPGDTKFSLARGFDVSIKTLESENPHIVNVLKAGDVITVSNAKDPSTMYVIAKGDTKFSLAKENGISIEQLERENPNIKNGLITGYVIHIPRANKLYSKTYVTSTTDSGGEKTAPETEVTDFVSYTLKTDNTLYGLSQVAGLKPSEFLLLNPHITNTVKKGTTVKMPSSADLDKLNEEMKSDKAIVSNPIKDSTAEVNDVPNEPVAEVAIAKEQESEETVVNEAEIEEEVAENEESGEEMAQTVNTATKSISSVNTNTGTYKELSRTINTNEQNKIVFLAPDELGTTIVDLKNKVTSSSENPKILKYLDFYKGAQMAIDSISKMGIEAEYKITLIENLKESTSSMDALVVPFYEGSAEDLVINMEDPNVPVIVTSELGDASGLNAIYSSPDLMASKQRVIDYVNKQNANLIIINDPRHRSDLEFIRNRTDNLRTVQTDNVGRFSSDELLKAMKRRGLNMVIIDSNDSNVYLGVTNLLLTKLNDFDIQLGVMDAALIPDETIVSTKRYKILKMIYPSTLPAIATEKEAKFINRFRKVYDQTPSENAIYGFDIVYDLLLRLAQNGELTETFKNTTTKQFNLKFQYIASENGFKNQGVYLFQYDPIEGIKEID